MPTDKTNSKDKSASGKEIFYLMLPLFLLLGFVVTMAGGPGVAYFYSFVFGSLGLIIAAFLVAIALIGLKNRKDKLQINDEIEALRRETLDDLITFQLDVDQVIRTRGIGSSFQESMENNPLIEKTIRRDLDRAILLLQKSTTPASKLESVARAEIVKAKVLDELK